MASSYLDQLKLTIKVVGLKNAELTLSKIQASYPSIRKSSDFTLSVILYNVANYVENINNSDYSILNKKTVLEIEDLWKNSISEYSKNYTSKNYIETNEIILDYRVNGVGYYWVDLKTHHSMEMIVRMDNCGRCNYEDNLIELREIDEKGNGFSHVAIVHNQEQGILYQIKGVGTEIPDIKFENYIYDLLMSGKLHIVYFNPQYRPDKDFKIKYFSQEKQTNIRKKYPQLFPKDLL